MLVPGRVFADTITGNVSVGLGQVSVSVQGIFFLGFDSSDSQCDLTGGTSGCFDVVSGTGTFANLLTTNPQVNSIQDLPAPPLSGPESIADYMMFDSGAVLFDLIGVVPGAAQNCATVADLTVPNISCTIYANYGTVADPDIQIAPFVDTNGPDNTTVSVSATAYFMGYTGDPGNGETLYRGIFTTQISDMNLSQLYSAIASGGVITNAWSASFSPVTPEPGTWLLASLGFIGICAARRVGA